MCVCMYTLLFLYAVLIWSPVNHENFRGSWDHVIMTLGVTSTYETPETRLIILLY